MTFADDAASAPQASTHIVVENMLANEVSNKIQELSNPPFHKCDEIAPFLFQSLCSDSRDWARIDVLSSDKIHDETDDKHAEEEHDAPVEGVQGHRSGIWPERPEECKCDIS